MRHHVENTVTTLETTGPSLFDGPPPAPAELTPAVLAPSPLCRLCARMPARLRLDRQRATPVELCLRCHHKVTRQFSPTQVAPPRRRSTVPRRSLIVPRDAALSMEAKYAELAHRRRRAQVAARRALEHEPRSLPLVQKAS